MKLDQWSVISRTFPMLEAPEQERCRLHGFVTGHPRCADGKEVTTSTVVSRHGNRVVTKSGSEYDLGDADTAYESLFPNARERFLAGLKPMTPQLLAVVYEI